MNSDTEKSLADTRVEGAFYVWSKVELDEILGEDAAVFEHFFGVKIGGNVSAQHDMHGELTGKVRIREAKRIANEIRTSCIREAR